MMLQSSSICPAHRRVLRLFLLAAIVSTIAATTVASTADAQVLSAGRGGYGDLTVTCLYQGKVRVSVSVSGDRYGQLVGAAVQYYDPSLGWQSVFPFTPQVVNQPGGYEASTASWSFTMNVPAKSRSWFWADYRWFYAGVWYGGAYVNGEMKPVDC
jgi:hypothetical protein